MPAPPPNQHLLLQRQVGRELIVLLGPEDGSSPTEENEAPYLRVIEISRSASSRTLDYCRMEFDFTLAGVSLENLKTPTKWKRQIEVRIADSEGKPRGGLLFWGELTRQSIAIEDKESCILTATVQPYHFGPAASGAALREFKSLIELDNSDPEAEPLLLLNNGDDLVFNPLIDEEIKFNQSRITDETLDYAIPIEVEATRTETARFFNNDNATPAEWLLSDVMFAIPRVCNPDEDYILNPDILSLDDDQKIRNLRLPLGETLPAYMDAVLLPLGYSWCLDYGVKQDPPPEPENEEDPPEPPPPPERVVTIRIFSRQEGPEKELYLQAKGERYDRALTNLNAVSVEWDIANLSNEIVGVMPPLEHEVTIELVRGWPAAGDSKTAEDLDRDNPASSYYSEEYGPDAWRLFVGNEANDYTGSRGVDGGGAGVPVVLNLDSVFGADQYLRRRRKLEDCLTFDSAGFRRRPFLEYKNPEYDPEIEGSIEWLPVPIEWGFVVLEEQIGIRFTGAQPPAELIAMGDDAKLRITGTIKADVRTEIIATSTASSPNGRKVVLYIDLADKFRYAQIQGTGPHASVLEQPYGSAEVLDVTQPDAYIQKIRDREQSAAVTASIELFGLHYNYQIGDVLTKIAGRNISLDRNAEEAEQSAYLQIMGIRWLPQEQKTEILTAPTEVSL